MSFTYSFDNEQDYNEAWKYLYKMGTAFDYNQQGRRITIHHPEQHDINTIHNIINHTGPYTILEQ